MSMTYRKIFFISIFLCKTGNSNGIYAQKYTKVNGSKIFSICITEIRYKKNGNSIDIKNNFTFFYILSQFLENNILLL